MNKVNKELLENKAGQFAKLKDQSQIEDLKEVFF
jgi:hypothetical protein